MCCYRFSFTKDWAHPYCRARVFMCLETSFHRSVSVTEEIAKRFSVLGDGLDGKYLLIFKAHIGKP